MKIHSAYYRLAAWTCFAALAAAILFRSLRHWFDADEIEGIHTAWKIPQGERIYLDFFQHHNPLFYFMLAPVIGFCGEHAWTLVACRVFMLPFVAGMVLVTFQLGRRIFGRRTAALAVLLVMASLCFAAKAIEVRPDVPQAFFGLLALVFLYPRVGRPSPFACAAAGACLGISFLFLQKAIFVWAAVGLVVLWRIGRRELDAARVAALVAGGLLSLAPFGWWLVARSDFQQYFFLNWTLNSHFVHHFGLWNGLLRTLVYQGGIFGLASLCLLPFPRLVRRRELIVLAAGAALLPCSARCRFLQYWLPLFPLLAVLAAAGFVRVGALRSRLATMLLIGCVLLPGAIGAAALDAGNGIFNQVPEAQQSYQLRRVAFVLASTGHDDLVYDGNVTFNVFRKDIDYFWYGIHPKNALATYASLRPVHFDLHEIIERTRPKVISTHLISVDDPRIRERYSPSTPFRDVLIRRVEKASPAAR